MSRPWTLRLSVIALVVACLGLGYVAGRPGTAAPPATYLEQLTATLGLSPAQVAAIDAILVAEDRAVDDLLTEKLEALREPVAERRARAEQELLAQLDDDQRALYLRLSEQEAEQR